jgi:hypothetical protein
MVNPRQRPSHRIRLASGLTRPATGITAWPQKPSALAEFFASFYPEDSDEIPSTPDFPLRWCSAPWDDIMDEPPLTPPPSPTQTSDQDSYLEDEEEPQDSVWVNLLQSHRPLPTFYRSHIYRKTLLSRRCSCLFSTRCSQKELVYLYPHKGLVSSKQPRHLP